jgi:hypothetical protein
MIELYPQIRLVHVAAVIGSGLLFASRGAAQLDRARQLRAKTRPLARHAADLLRRGARRIPVHRERRAHARSGGNVRLAGVALRTGQERIRSLALSDYRASGGLP